MVKYVEHGAETLGLGTVMCSVYGSNHGFYATDQPALEKKLTDYAVKELLGSGVRVVGYLPSGRGSGGPGELINILQTVFLNLKHLWNQGHHLKGILVGLRLGWGMVQSRARSKLSAAQPKAIVNLSLRSAEKEDGYVFLGLEARMLELDMLAEFVARRLKLAFPDYGFDYGISIWLEDYHYSIDSFFPLNYPKHLQTLFRRTLLEQVPLQSTHVSFRPGLLRSLCRRISANNDDNHITYFTHISANTIGDKYRNAPTRSIQATLRDASIVTGK